jgi:hypothetical protein
MGTRGEVVRVARLGPSGTWEAETVSAPVPAAARLDLAARPDGEVALAWEVAGGEIHAVTSGDARLPAVRLSLPGRPSSSPSLAFGPEGALVCVWADGLTGISAASGRDGDWSPPVVVGTGSGHVTLPSVCGGSAAWVAAWARSGGGIESASLPAGGGWSGVETIGSPEVDPFGAIVRGGANGDFLAGWVRSGGTVQMAGRTREGRWEAARDVGPVGEGASGIRFTVARDGAVSALWTRQGGRVALAGRSPDGEWGEVLTLEEWAFGPRIAGHPSGWGVGAWHRANVVIGAVVVDPSGLPGAISALSREGEPCRHPSGAIGSDGRAVVAWRRDDGAVQVARHDAGSWSEPEEVCGAGGSSGPPRVACWDDGSVVVAWIGGSD